LCAWGQTPADDLAARQFKELETWYEQQYRSVPGGPAPTREDWKRLVAAEYKFLEPKPVFEPVSDSVSLVSWPLMQVGTMPSTRGSSVARVRLSGFFRRAKQGGRRPAVIALTPWASDEAHVFELVTARREAFAQPWIEDRQWLDRLATQTGRTLLGAEAAQVSAVAGWLAGLDDVDPARIAVAGGREAIAAAAIDPRLHVLSDVEPAPLWTLPQDLSIWRQARGFDWPAIAGWTAGLQVNGGAGAESHDRAWAKAYNAMFAGWQAYFRNAALEAYAARGKATLEDYFDVTGRYPAPYGPMEPESTLISGTPEVKAYRVSVRVYDGVHAVGILLVPQQLDLTKRHPMVFVQHGLAGRPEDTIADGPVYRGFGLELARRGYVVFAPMISTQTVIGRNELVRRARPLGLTVAGMERTKFSRLLDYFETLPYIDRERIGFYGLSYGGYTSLWVTPGEPRFKVVVCSGHFNEWTVKTTDLTMGSSYMYYADHLDMYNHGLLARFGHAELAGLLAPRPVLIEMGSDDGVMVAPRRLVDEEVARSGAAVARFNGVHRIDGVEAYAFLDRHLKPGIRRP
jgi:cephalosporin-C deacetylase-like acetyl esterase